MALLQVWAVLVETAETLPSTLPSLQANKEGLGLLVVVVDAHF
jgi:hypothetical protein